jgi:hypothetical protein
MVEGVQIDEISSEEVNPEGGRVEGPDALDRILIDTGIIEAVEVVPVEAPLNLEEAEATEVPENSETTDADEEVVRQRRGIRRRSK